MKATAIAPANIAFIKYWGKKNDALRLPLNSSISMNLSGAFTTSTVEFSPDYSQDTVGMVGEEFSQKEQNRVITQLDVIRKFTGCNDYARIVTKNSFPKGTGAASSASGFAALTVAALHALSFSATEKEMTILARIGSGSACRSIPDGFVEWQSGEQSEDSYAYSLAPASHWELCDVLAIVSKEEKKVATTIGMEGINTSPFWKERIAGMPEKLQLVRKAIADKKLHELGKVIEEDAINMHAIMMTQDPPLFYWNDSTMRIIHTVRSLRAEGLSVYFTIDAGPNVHLICETKDESTVAKKITSISGVETVLLNHVTKGAHITNDHLF